MKVRIDQTMCIRCGVCAVTCPEVFMQEEAGGSIKIASEIIPTKFEKLCERAEIECETGAITIEN